MDISGGFLSPGDIQISTTWCTGTHKNGVKVFGENRLQTVDTDACTELGPKIEHIAHFFIDHRFGQTELRYLRADHAPGACVAVINYHLIAQRQQIARHR